MSAGFRHGSHNLLFTLNHAKWTADLDRSHELSDVRCFQEAGDQPQRMAMRAHVKKHRLGYYHPRGVSIPIAWRRDVFAGIAREKGCVKVHDSAGFMKYNPARHLVWRGLRHKATGKRVLVVAVHASAGYAKPEPNQWGDRANDWKDESARLYWLSLVELLAAQMRRGVWDAIIIGGDFNARLNNTDEWYYPGPLLSSLTVADGMNRSIDRLIFTVDSQLRRTGRFAVDKGVHSDHPLHFARYEFR